MNRKVNRIKSDIMIFQCQHSLGQNMGLEEESLSKGVENWIVW